MTVRFFVVAEKRAVTDRAYSIASCFVGQTESLLRLKQFEIDRQKFFRVLSKIVHQFESLG